MSRVYGVLITIWRLIRETFRRWVSDGVFEMSAAIAFYAAFSTAPALAFLIRIFGLVAGDRGGAELEAQVAAWVGVDAGRLIALAATGAGDRMRLGGFAGAFTSLFCL